MLLVKNLCLSGLLGFSLIACTAGNGLTGGGTGKKEGDDGDKEEEPSDEPVEVAGSFLTSCSEAPDKAAPDGEVAMGCTVHDEDKKVETADVEVTVHFADGSSETPAMTPEPADSPYNATFTLTEAKHEALAAIDLAFEVDGKKFKQDSVGNTLPDLLESTYLLAFTTSGTYSIYDIEQPEGPAFQGPEQANNICRRIASDENLGQPEAWHAILSLTGAPPYQIDYGVKSANFDVTATKETFWTLGAGVFQYDEGGNPVPSDTKVWTGMNPDGSETCDGWNNEGAMGAISKPFAPVGMDWLNVAHASCTEALHLYCILLK